MTSMSDFGSLRKITQRQSPQSLRSPGGMPCPAAHCRSALAIKSIARARRDFPTIYAPKVLLDGYRRPPSPQECIFAQTTKCFASDLFTVITPCQLGGQAECRECGCVASAGLASIGRFRLAGLVKVGDIFRLSRRIGEIRNSRNHKKQPSAKTPVAWLQRDHFDLTKR
jgi:hypothetical protein